VDEQALAPNAKDFPKAKLYVDFRKMLETQKDIDAVVVATPDHNYAIAEPHSRAEEAVIPCTDGFGHLSECLPSPFKGVPLYLSHQVRCNVVAEHADWNTRRSVTAVDGG